MEEAPAGESAPNGDQVWEARLRELIETSQDAILFINKEGEVVLTNPAACTIFGYREEELMGADVRILMAEPYASNHKGYVERYETTGEQRAIGRIRQVTAIRKSGQEFPIELSVMKLSSYNDAARYGAFIRDVSEKVRLQGERMERERAATVGTTASMLVHEIGNPLNNMALQLQALKRRVMRLKEDQGAVEKVESCLLEIERLNRLVQEFRALSGRRRVLLQPIALAKVVEITLSHLRVRPSVKVRRDFEEEEAEVMADSDKMQQVLLNLFQNAVDAMPEGGTLSVSTRSHGQEYVLEVADTGEGVPQGLDIFDPFVTSKPHGTGLGLAICSEIVREHEGRLTYETQPGEGTVFRVVLPRARRRAAPTT